MAADLRLATLALPGLSPNSLGNYLASLGLLRLLSRKWSGTRIAWRDDVLHLVGGAATLDELLDELLRIASTQGTSDVSKREWTQYDKAWSEAQKKGTKAKSGVPLALWQAEAHETELQFFVAHAVPHARVSFNPLLGSGGNAGRRDFAAGWKQAVDVLAASPRSAKGRGKKKVGTGAGDSTAPDERRSALQALLLGQPITWLVEKLAAGSWFSEATKLYNSGQSSAREGQMSPWAMALACEGLAFLAGGASRRLGARSRAVGAFPFVTQSIAPEVAGEAGRILGEIWTPLWTRPMSLAETTTLFSRGRAEVRGRGALTPAAFATAIRERGVDAGVSEFCRFTLGRTTSANTFEPRFEARFALDVGAATMGDATALVLERVTALIEQRGFPRDRKVGQRWRFEGLRGPIEATLLDVAADPRRSEAAIALLDAISSALDRIDRNHGLRERNLRWEPLPLEWLPSLFDEQLGVEARLALSLVSSFPLAQPFATYRFGVQWKFGETYAYYVHDERPPARWVWGPGDPARVLGTVLSRRLLDQEDAPVHARRGRAPLPATTTHIRQWLAGEVDESLFSAWLSRFALFDWRKVPRQVRAFIDVEANGVQVDGSLALLGLVQPLVDQRSLIVRDLSTDDLLSDQTGARTTEVARSLVTLIRGGNLDHARRLASSRYAMAGLRLAEFDVSWGVSTPDRLVAALLLTISDRERAVLFERWLRPRRRQLGGEANV